MSAVTLSVASLAVAAISTIDNAIRSVNTPEHAGAFQNRLEFTISTLAIQEENSAFGARSGMRISRRKRFIHPESDSGECGHLGACAANVVPQTAAAAWISKR